MIDLSQEAEYNGGMDSKHYDNKLLTELRVRLGMSREDVASTLKKTRQTVFRAEKGESVSYEMLAAMTALYGVPITTILYARPDATEKNLAPA